MQEKGPEGLWYEYDEGTDGYAVAWIGDAGAGKELVLPASFQGKPVTKIGRAALSGGRFERVVVPDCVIEIGEKAFEGGNVEEVVLGPGSNLRRIGFCAFQSCSSLKKIDLPDGLRSVGYYAFSGTALQRDSSLRDECGAFYLGKHLIAARAPFEGAYRVRPGTKTIAERAFYSYCPPEIVFPESLKRIPAEAFLHRSDLRSVSIPEGVVAVERGAFSGCVSLTDVVLPSTLTEVGADAFFGCASLREIEIPKGVTEIGDDAFASCRSLSRIVLPDRPIAIGMRAFYDTAAYYYGRPYRDERGTFYLGRHLIEAKDVLEGPYEVRPDTLSVADRAFYWCGRMTEVKLKNGQLPKTAAKINVN